jgi:hypothetical protein
MPHSDLLIVALEGFPDDKVDNGHDRVLKTYLRFMSRSLSLVL